jgi:hypothetical protein
MHYKFEAEVSENAEKRRFLSNFCNVLWICGFVIKFAGAHLLFLSKIMFLGFIRAAILMQL